MKDSKQRILLATSELFMDTGLNGLTVRAIADKANLSTIGIYSHFKGKQGILDALYIQGFERVSEALNVNVFDQSPKNAVLEASRNYLKTATEYAAHYRLIFGESDSRYTPSDEARTAGIHAFKALTELIGRLLPQDAADQDKQKAALKIWAIVHGYTSLHQHAVAQLMDLDDWQAQTLETIAQQIDLLGKRY